MFERLISIDWAGSGTEDQRVNFRVVEANRKDLERVVVDPPNANVGTRAWTRAECREWLVEALKPDQPRCLVAMDFGFGYPRGTDGAVFVRLGWRQMLRAIAEVYEREGSARRAAGSINLRPVFGGHGPYRFNQNRTDIQFSEYKNTHTVVRGYAIRIRCQSAAVQEKATVRMTLCGRIHQTILQSKQYPPQCISMHAHKML